MDSLGSTPADAGKAVVNRRDKGKRPVSGPYRPKGKSRSTLSVPPHVNDDAMFSQVPRSAASPSAVGGVGPRPAAGLVPGADQQPSATYSSRGSQTLQPSSLSGLGVNAHQVSASLFPDSGQSSPAPRVQQSGRPFCPPPSQSRGELDYEMYSDGSADGDGVYSEVLDNELYEQPPEEDAVPSFDDALALLQRLLPSLFSRAEAAPARPMSAIASAMARAPAHSPVTSASLLESAHVTSAIEDSLATVRGSKDPSSSTLPEFPNGFKCGRYLRPRPVSRGNSLGSKGLVCRSALPDGVPPANQEDLLVAAAGSHPVTLSDKNLADNEEFARRALDACSVLDSFVAGLVESIKCEDQSTFQAGLLDSRSINAFAGAIDVSLRFATDSLAKLLLNTVLARRDALLTSSSSVSAPLARSALRLAPLSSSSLFDGRVQQLLHRQAEVQRDLALNLPQSRPSAPQRKRPAVRPPSVPRPKAPRFGPYSRPPPAPGPSQQPRRRAPPRRPPTRRPQPPRSGPAGRGHPQ